jgi:lactoylglutathione lyase
MELTLMTRAGVGKLIHWLKTDICDKREGMKLGYTIIYVPDVLATIAFYETAFGLQRRFVHESNLYAELETGSTTLAFAGEPMATMNGLEIRQNRPADIAAGFEIAFVTDDPEVAYRKAVNAGASAVKPPAEKPWGQVVGYVRDLNGCLVEICSPVTG